MAVDVKSLNKEAAELTDRALEELLPSARPFPFSIHGAMRHSTFAGGKRLRPVLATRPPSPSPARFPKGIERWARPSRCCTPIRSSTTTCPLSTTTTLRRGKPTCHVVFGEAIAILAGDALQTRAFEVLAGLDTPARGHRADHRPRRQRHRHRRRHDRRPGAGHRKRARASPPPNWSTPSTAPRPARSSASASSPAASTPEPPPTTSPASTCFGRKAGLAFQIADDVLDMTEDSAHWARPPARTWPRKKSPGPPSSASSRAERDAARLIEEAFAALAPYGEPRRRPESRGPLPGRAQELAMLTEAEILTALRDCYDPEVKLNLVDLGLIYAVTTAPTRIPRPPGRASGSR
jgi:geranylgeranyl diphosphate synthase type II